MPFPTPPAATVTAVAWYHSTLDGWRKCGSYAGRLYHGCAGAATGTPVYTSGGEVSTQLTRCSRDVCPLSRTLYCRWLLTLSCQSWPPAYCANACSARLASSVSSLYPYASCWSSALVATVTISRYHCPLCHDIAIHNKSSSPITSTIMKCPVTRCNNYLHLF